MSLSSLACDLEMNGESHQSLTLTYRSAVEDLMVREDNISDLISSWTITPGDGGDTWHLGLYIGLWVPGGCFDGDCMSKQIGLNLQLLINRDAHHKVH